MIIETVHYIDASHQLQDSDDLHTKKCAQLHGHTYKIKVEIEADNSHSGMVIDFGKIKEAVNVLDHRHINEVFQEVGEDLFKFPPTAENIAIFLARVIAGECDLIPKSVSVCEGFKGDEHSNWVTYRPLEIE